MPKCEMVELDFVDRASIVSTAEVTVAATPSQVWGVLTDTPRWTEWFKDMKACERTSVLSEGVGYQRHVRIGLFTAQETVIVWEPEKHWGFSLHEIGWQSWIAKRMLETVQIEPHGTGSRLTYTGAVDPTWWMKPFKGMLSKQLASAWGGSLANIDNHLSIRN